MTSFDNEQAFAELYYSRKAIKDVLGVTPQCWSVSSARGSYYAVLNVLFRRPPYGDVDNRIRYIASALNLSTIVWGYDTADWRETVPGDNVTAQDVTNNYAAVINGTQNGTFATHGPIVLTHELSESPSSSSFPLPFRRLVIQLSVVIVIQSNR